MENPYQSTSIHLDPPAEAAPVLVQPGPRPNFWWLLSKWGFVCTLSALPSFFWGCSISALDGMKIAAMCSGIAVFSIAYACVESLARVREFMSDVRIRRTARVGYGTRIAISLIFPVGATLDLFVGIMSTAIGETLVPGSLEYDLLAEATTQAMRLYVFFGYFITTIIQGILLNIVLFAYMAIVAAIVFAFSNTSLPRVETPIR